MNTSTSLARVVVRQLIEAGITDAVISPGSRNAPLSLAMYAAAEKGFLKLHIRIDERSAAYFALGLAKGHEDAIKHCRRAFRNEGYDYSRFHEVLDDENTKRF